MYQMLIINNKNCLICQMLLNILPSTLKATLILYCELMYNCIVDVLCIRHLAHIFTMHDINIKCMVFASFINMFEYFQFVFAAIPLFTYFNVKQPNFYPR